MSQKPTRTRFMFSASLKTDTTNYYERIQNHKTGATKVREHSGPVTGFSKLELSTKPFKISTEKSSHDGERAAYRLWTREATDAGVEEKKTSSKKNQNGKTHEESQLETYRGEAYDTTSLYE